MEETLRTMMYLSAGLFMGWSLGANDAANIFGTAVTTRMVRFNTAALIMAVMVTLGAVISGAGPTATLGALGTIDLLEEAFLVSLTAAGTVMLMTSRGLPVSTSQSIVGAIVGWNLHAEQAVNWELLTKIAGTWFFAPVLGAIFAALFYGIMREFQKRSSIHILQMDRLLRMALVTAGAFGAYSLGANNMANVMGIFVHNPVLRGLNLGSVGFLSIQQWLFLLGGLAVSVGVFTYSHRVMKTIGSGIYQLTPPAALIVVLASATVLFLFASQGLKDLLTTAGLPSLPLVPVSQSQTVVGAVIGIGLVRGGRNINLRILASIAVGWILTPLLSMILAFFLLSFA